MARPTPDKVRRVACVGTGLMGGGWAAHFLAKGFDVSVQDPDPKAEAKLHRLLDQAWPFLEELGLAPGASRSRLKFSTSLGDIVKDADFIQESAPEKLEIKVKLLPQIEEAAPKDIVISSSTSGFIMSDIQKESIHPERTVIGHPFNPPHIIPLVEVCGGRKTSEWAVDWACDFYNRNGHYAIKMIKEAPGHIANRLQQAMWHEALHMVQDGIATPEQINAAIRQGPGLRWAMMGSFVHMHMAGGEGGMRHFFEHFDMENASVWSKLASPKLTPEMKTKVIEACERMAEGKSYTELSRARDKNLVAIIKALRANKDWVKG
ncbi:MAG: 3-hydroxyacyl-CoA dehydrogenase NAD-binding domain-containing protein [Alphaproteobacteria bacterium]